MIVKDKQINRKVNVSDSDCPKRSCYWPRPDPGVFVQGKDYYEHSTKQGWLCGTREIKGCPINKEFISERGV